ncbi:Hit1p [Lachancea thermotolerans CBS 6340]|uniref:KLTH0C02860p n=1 Tax=Lachancea thermotolerans (strain ATCC 56472 / CBS 6340 / NRRL Y-8284) TaxID=559295 RepID=C5DDQ3_LACTC|nr:KLTH0C02860p [Lachancea thermotolerans CBS 6340]CAR21914.1 KLTH0C02860p [Lachancea thermotolerans CBS 6340]
MSAKCEICNQEPSKYKCPKCAVRYCSLSCFKDQEKHVHSEKEAEEKKHVSDSEGPEAKSDTGRLPTEQFDELYQNTKEIQELLSYNTVKFHLAKVYRILNIGVGALGSSDTQTSAEVKQQLAVDYLNTLRYGGVHYNEAIEEFCQVSLAKLSNES